MRTYSLALRLALSDVKLQYRRSTLGPWWTSLTLLAQILTIGFLFTRLFSTEASSYLLHLGSGLIAWAFVVSSLNQSSRSLIGAGSLVRQVPIPLMTHPLRVLVRNAVQLAHNLVILLPVYLFSNQQPNWWTVLVLLGAALVVLNLSWMGVILSIVSARFRDFPEIVAGILVLLFYVTPILWSVDQLEGYWVQDVVIWNPFYHFIEVLRNPLLGHSIPVSSLAVLSIGGIVGGYLARTLVRRKSAQVPFWV